MSDVKAARECGKGAMRGVWTRERIALLKRLWTDGETATAIAGRLRMSKSAVLGKVFRLRLRPAAKATAAAARSEQGGPRSAPQRPATGRTGAGKAGRTGNGVGENAVRIDQRIPAAGRTASPAQKLFTSAARRARIWKAAGLTASTTRGAPMSATARAAAARAGAADPPITSPSIVPSGEKRLVFSQGRKRS